MASTYQDAHRNACCNAITALGKAIGLYVGTTKVGATAAILADTTWGSAVKVNEAISASDSTLVDWAKATGSTVTLTVPAGTVANGTVINKYGVHNGTTLLRTEDLPVALTINDGSQAFSVDITPIFRFRGV